MGMCVNLGRRCEEDDERELCLCSGCRVRVRSVRGFLHPSVEGKRKNERSMLEFLPLKKRGFLLAARGSCVFAYASSFFVVIKLGFFPSPLAVIFFLFSVVNELGSMLAGTSYLCRIRYLRPNSYKPKGR